jgi:Leucine-rich repeat (LRR) protein
MAVLCNDDVACASERLSRIGLGLTCLAALPELVFATSLQSLCLHGNQLTSLGGLQQLSALTELNVSSNALPALDDALCKLTNLRCAAI